MSLDLKSFADVQRLLRQILTENGQIRGVASAPHKSFWTTLSYHDFVTGNVPNVSDPATGRPLPILVKGDSAHSNLILSLQGRGPLFDSDTGTIGPMPANGPPMFTDAQIALIAAWIDAGCPE